MSATRRDTLFTNPVINHPWGKEMIVITTHGHFPLSRVKYI